MLVFSRIRSDRWPERSSRSQRAGRLWGVCGKMESERSSLRHQALTADAAAVDALHKGQPDACALEFLRPVQTLEGQEELFDTLHAQTYTAVHAAVTSTE